MASPQHEYRAFGLRVTSSFALPLSPATESGVSDVQIQRGSVVSSGLAEATVRTPFLNVAPGILWVRTPDNYRILVHAGKSITIDASPEADDALLRLYLTTTCMTALLHQRQALVLHAAAVQVGDGAVLFAGPSTSGKSSLAALFQQNGYAVLADDLCAIDGQGCLQPGETRLHLWRDTIDKLGIPDALREPVRPQLAKYALPLAQPLPLPLPVRAVYILDSHNRAEHVIESLKGIDKYAALHKCIPHPHFADGIHPGSTLLRRYGDFAGRVAISRITRPDDGYRFRQLFRLIVSDLERIAMAAA